MEKEFVPYELALRMKELGFDEPCFAMWTQGWSEFEWSSSMLPRIFSSRFRLNDTQSCEAYFNNIDAAFGIAAPTWQSAFNWFLEKHSLYFRPDYLDELKEYDFQGSIHKLGKYNAIVFIGNHKTHKEAELASLTKLIEIVETK
jgi:hypothetical protein